MGRCIDCGNVAKTSTYVKDFEKYVCLCDSCRKIRDQNRVLEKSKSVQKCSDFKEWSGRDMSELFWIHLGRYVKEPNPESIDIMEMALRWACHADHGLSNNFYHALDWAGIDLYKEELKWRNG